MSKYDSFVLDLISDVMRLQITIPEVRACVDELERTFRDAQKRASDVRTRRKADAALGLRPWP